MIADRSKERWGLFLVLAALLAVVGGKGAEAARETPAPHETARAHLASLDIENLQVAFREVARAVGPSVVSIAAVPPQLLRVDDATFERGILSSSRLVVGSGAVISEEGHIVTNAHVARTQRALAVILPDRRVLRARHVGIDDQVDLAVLSVEADDLVAIPFGDCEKVQVGDWVVAAGSPFGLSHTITAGIVSAVGRADVGIADYEEFIQTDAAINPGNSGGPLVNLKGELIGINTAIASRSGSSAGIGFAIPTRMVRYVAQRLAESGRIERGMIGVAAVDVDDSLAAASGLEERRGVMLLEIFSGGPAARSGLRAGDILLAWDGREVNNSNTFRNRVAMTKPGADVPIIVWRDGERHEISLTVATAAPYQR